MAQISMHDGAMQQVWAAAHPAPFYGVTLKEASYLAEGALLPGETLTGGALTWDPALDEPRAPSPFFPYYSFTVTDEHGEPSGELQVMLRDGAVSYVPRAQAATP